MTPFELEISEILNKLVQTVDSQWNVGNPKAEALTAIASVVERHYCKRVHKNMMSPDELRAYNAEKKRISRQRQAINKNKGEV